jgi:hypothetical protein
MKVSRYGVDTPDLQPRPKTNHPRYRRVSRVKVSSINDDTREHGR